MLTVYKGKLINRDYPKKSRRISDEQIHDLFSTAAAPSSAAAPTPPVLPARGVSELSRESYHNENTQEQAGTQKALVIDYLIFTGGATARQVFEHLKTIEPKIEKSSIHARLDLIRKDGILREDEDTFDETTRRRVTLYRIINNNN